MKEEQDAQRLSDDEIFGMKQCAKESTYNIIKYMQELSIKTDSDDKKVAREALIQLINFLNLLNATCSGNEEIKQ